MVTGDKYAELLGSGLRRPQLVAAAKRDRKRPTNLLGPHGKMFVIAADHAARGALSAGSNPLAMGDRRELLTRLCRALERPAVNGVLGSADILEELLLLGALEGKTVFGSMNRGGIVGSQFEADDRFTGYTASALASSGFEGGKMLLKITPSDPRSARTLESCAQAIDELAHHSLLAMIEPFMSVRSGADLANDLSTEAVIRSVGIASALGATAAYTWLKLPNVADMERVLNASTLPTLILGGEVNADQDLTLANWAKTLSLPGASGLVVGRSLLFPPDDDVDAALDAATAIL